MARFVVLRHDCPDGSWHYDWMIERADTDAERRLVSFRLSVLPGGADRFDAERIGDHRAAYLDYEGEVSGGRGRVSRVDGGEAAIEALEPGRMLIVLDGAVRLAGETADGRRWSFARVRA